MSAVNEQEAPQGGAAREFLMLTFAGGLFVAVVLVAVLGSGAGLPLWALWPTIIAFVVARRRGIAITGWGLAVLDRRALLGPALAVVVIAVVMVLRAALIGSPAAGLSEDTVPTLLYVLITLPLFALMGVITEVPWRGLLLTELAPRGLVSAIAWSSLAALLWMAPRTIAGLAGAGMALVALALLSLTAFHLVAGWLRVRTGSIYASTGFYAVWMSVASRGPADHDPAAMAIGVTVLVLTAAILLGLRLPRKEQLPSWARR